MRPPRRETRDTESQKFVREQEAAILQVTKEAAERRKAVSTGILCRSLRYAGPFSPLGLEYCHQCRAVGLGLNGEAL